MEWDPLTFNCRVAMISFFCSLAQMGFLLKILSPSLMVCKSKVANAQVKATVWAAPRQSRKICVSVSHCLAEKPLPFFTQKLFLGLALWICNQTSYYSRQPCEGGFII